MKICPACHSTVEDTATVCPHCGAIFTAQNAAQQPSQDPQPQNTQQPPVGQPYYAAPASIYDPTDHTAQFDPQDIAQNKLYAILPYLTSVLGIIIALLAAKDSPFVNFHVRQGLRLAILEILLGVIAALLFWTIIVPLAAVVCELILLVVQIICFFAVCSGKAKDAPIVSSFAFLR